MATGRQVKDNGWRQGRFLPAAMVSELAAEHPCEGATEAIVISQDCDVTHPDLEAEPFVEILFLHPLYKINPGFQDGKSSRMLHLEAHEGTGKRFFQTQPWNKARVRREVLATAPPNPSLSLNPGTLRGMIQWVADRYTRTGFPDEFVRRIEAIDGNLKKLMKKHGGVFWRILVHLKTYDELEETTEYVMDCTCVVWPEAWDDEKGQEKAQTAAAKLKQLLEGCPGIALDQFEVDTADEIPMSYLVHYRPWDVFNYLTHRDLLKEDSDHVAPASPP
jgi:hypothetical protein